MSSSSLCVVSLILAPYFLAFRMALSTAPLYATFLSSKAENIEPILVIVLEVTFYHFLAIESLTLALEVVLLC